MERCLEDVDSPAGGGFLLVCSCRRLRYPNGMCVPWSSHLIGLMAQSHAFRAAWFKRDPPPPPGGFVRKVEHDVWLLNLSVDIDLPTYFPGFFPFLTPLLTI